MKERSGPLFGVFEAPRTSTDRPHFEEVMTGITSKFEGARLRHRAAKRSRPPTLELVLSPSAPDAIWLALHPTKQRLHLQVSRGTLAFDETAIVDLLCTLMAAGPWRGAAHAQTEFFETYRANDAALPTPLMDEVWWLNVVPSTIELSAIAAHPTMSSVDVHTLSRDARMLVLHGRWDSTAPPSLRRRAHLRASVNPDVDQKAEFARLLTRTERIYGPVATFDPDVDAVFRKAIAWTQQQVTPLITRMAHQNPLPPPPHWHRRSPQAPEPTCSAQWRRDVEILEDNAHEVLELRRPLIEGLLHYARPDLAELVDVWFIGAGAWHRFTDPVSAAHVRDSLGALCGSHLVHRFGARWSEAATLLDSSIVLGDQVFYPWRFVADYLATPEAPVEMPITKLVAHAQRVAG